MLGEWAMYDFLTPLPVHLGGRKTAPPLDRVWAIPVTVATPWLDGGWCSWWDGWATFSIPPRCFNGKEEEQSPRHSPLLFSKKLQVAKTQEVAQMAGRRVGRPQLPSFWGGVGFLGG
jgi:hypothetical protein